MREDLLAFLEKEVRERCESDRNFFGMGCFYHIQAVVRNAAHLAETYGADREVVIIASWLHDIASITDYNLYDEHHAHGAEMARGILERFDYPADKIRRVQDCILHHRGSEVREKWTVEEVCVADADALSHLDNVPALFYLAYEKKKLDIREGTEFVRNKVSNSYHKLSPVAQVVYREKFDRVMSVLEH